MQPRTAFTAHPSDDTVEEYAFVRLAGEEAAAFEEHLLICEICRQRLCTEDDYIRLMRCAARARSQTAPRKANRAAWRTRAAAGVVSAAVLTAVLLGIPAETPRSPIHVDLMAWRGGDQMPHVAAGRMLEVAIDVSDVPASPAYRVQIVDAAGRQEWSARGPSTGTRLILQVSKALSRGVHWVRLSSAEGELLREFGLKAD